VAKDDDILAEARDAFKECEEAESENREAALDDLKFGRLGEQWPEEIRKQREKDGRPCLTIPRLNAFVRQVVNDARQNKPSIKVHPVDSGADKETAAFGDLGQAVRDYEARNKSRTEIWLRHFAGDGARQTAT
jgi:hypothetical protein